MNALAVNRCGILKPSGDRFQTFMLSAEEERILCLGKLWREKNIYICLRNMKDSGDPLCDHFKISIFIYERQNI